VSTSAVISSVSRDCSQTPTQTNTNSTGNVNNG